MLLINPPRRTEEHRRLRKAFLAVRRAKVVRDIPIGQLMACHQGIQLFQADRVNALRVMEVHLNYLLWLGSALPFRAIAALLPLVSSLRCRYCRRDDFEITSWSAFPCFSPSFYTNQKFRPESYLTSLCPTGKTSPPSRPNLCHETTPATDRRIL